jgi:protein-L-isoaspartate(D-aspartate) O-methyltransferase
MRGMSDLRKDMITRHVVGRGVSDPLVLKAIRKVRRELFVPSELRRHAYADSPLPIGSGQTISQPYIVAFMIEALELEGGERILEIGTGSGYAAAVLAEIASEVYTVERVGQLAEKAAINLQDAGYRNVYVKHADGTLGWSEMAPFDAILVSAGSPSVPPELKAQLKVGGRLVIPVGATAYGQELIRLRRKSKDAFAEEDLADVRFVPLIGKAGWEETAKEETTSSPRVILARPRIGADAAALVARHAQSFSTIEDANLEPLLERIGDARVVLLGECTHGTAEFYSMRARLTQALIEDKEFNTVAIEADWPDAARIDHYVRERNVPASSWKAFARFPTWMWRNEEFRSFAEWVRRHNARLSYEARVAFYGLDLYSLYTSIRAVLDYLKDVDPELGEVARQRYGCLTPWEADPAAYGRAAVTGAYQACEEEVARMLVELMQKRQDLAAKDPERFLDAEQNTRLIANAERYYRTMFYGSRTSWNLRDSHMLETLRSVLARRSGSKAVVWAHNSHIGDALATEMSQRGEHNLGQLCRREFGSYCHLIGFGTDHGTVAAASAWDEPMQLMDVRPSHPQSYEKLCHLTQKPSFILALSERSSAPASLREELTKPRLERAIGVVYRPDMELASHYFEAVLPQQFDDYVWFDRTRAVTPLSAGIITGLPDTYPFGL